jgi:hypothetical protein
MGPFFGQVDFTVEQTLKSRCTVTQMHADDAIIDFAATAQPLPCGANGLVTALGRSRFIDATNRLKVAVVPCHQLLALVTDAGAIPLD